MKALLLGIISIVLGLGSTTSQGRVIEGALVPSEFHQEVVALKVGDSKCTATIVGPRVLLTAAHCVKDNGAASFVLGEKEYKAQTYRSSLYPNEDHDVAVVVTTETIQSVIPATLGSSAEKGESIFLLGYGCTETGGGGGNDGKLRIGKAEVVNEANFDFVAKGAALCFGDSGGPAYLLDEENVARLIGIGSKGNISETSYFASLTSDQSKKFLKDMVNTHGVGICGLNMECSEINFYFDAVTPPGPPVSIRFEKNVYEFEVNVGEDAWIDLEAMLEVPLNRHFQPLWFVGPLAPEWVRLNQKLNILHGAPTEAHRGTSSFTIVIRDQHSASAAIIKITVN